MDKEVKILIADDHPIIREGLKRVLENSIEVVKCYEAADGEEAYNMLKTDEFDIATISMALHQFPTILGLKIIDGLKRISKELIIIDYSFPLPKNIYKSIVYILERLAGRDHYKNFKSYLKYGGIESYIKEVKLVKSFETKTGNNIFTIVHYLFD